MKDEDKTKGQLINELIEVRQRIAELGKSKTGRKRTQKAPQESEELYPHTHPLDIITSLKPGDHLCCLYETEEEHRSLLIPFLRQGLEWGEKVLYIVDAHTADTVLGYLRDDGLEVAPYLASGQLGILTGDDVYLLGGVFDPDGMIGLLRSETGRALAEGYTALRLTGEMTWALRGLLGSERLIEYESKLNTFFPGSKCLAICQYDRRRFDAQVLLDVLATHPIAVVGGEVYNNFYYMTPGDLLGPDRPAATLRSWLESLAERKRVETTLRESQAKYRILVERSLQGLIVAQDEPLRIVFANPTCTEITGYSVQELLSLSPDKVHTLVHPEDRAMVLDRLRDRLAGRMVPSRYECRILRKDGTVRWVDVFSSRIEYSKEPAVQVSLIDITEHKGGEEALRNSEEKYKELADLLPQTVFELDERGNFTFSNRHGFEVSGYTQEDIDKGLNALDLFIPEDRDRVKDNMRRMLSGEKSGGNEYTALRKDGSTFPAIIYSAPIIRDNRSVGLRGIVIDIRERKQAEEKLRESEKRYRLLAENVADALWTVDLNHRLTYASPSITRLLGYSVDEAKAKAMEEVFTPASVEAAMKVLEEELAVEKMEQKDLARSRVLEFELKRKDGAIVSVEAKCTFLRDSDGQPVEILAVVRDITERKQAEQALRESEEKFRNLAEQSPNMIFINKKGKVVYANEKCAEVTGYKKEEFYSPDFDFLTLIAPESVDSVKEAFSRYMKGEEVAPYEHTVITKEGKRIEAIITTKLISYEGENAILGVVTDITKRKHMEEEIKNRDKELELQAINLEEANTALKVLLKRHEEDKKELEERIMSNVKELVFPCMERLRTSRLDARQTAYVDILTSYINDLVSPFARTLSSSYYNLTFKEIQVASLVREGKTNKEVAELLNISTRTVKFHRDNLRKKLGLRNKKVNLRSHLLSIL